MIDVIDCKIEIIEIDLNHTAVYCREIDNKSVAVFGKRNNQGLL